MIHTIDNPKLVNDVFSFRGVKTFTGVVKDKDDDIAYYLNGKFHRIDGPAVISANCIDWYQNGELHREDGPAIEWSNGNKAWYLNGKLHREDGPAIELVDGYKSWHLNNKCYGCNDHYTNESWIRFVKLELLK